MKLKIEPTEGSTCGEYDLIMLCDDGVWDWLHTFPSRAAAKAGMKEEYEACAACDGAERMYAAQYAYACGYHD